MAKPTTHAKLTARWRITLGDVVALGPGKADLLAGIAACGSLTKAARQMKMSYMRAWLLVQERHRCFAEPLVQMERGGSSGGGATLTEAGTRALALYRQIEEKSQQAAADDWKKLQRLLRPSDQGLT